MGLVIIGLWGWFFGTALLVVVASALAYGRSLKRIAANAALSAAFSALFALAFLGGFPEVPGVAPYQVLALIQALVSSVLAHQLLSTSGLLKAAGHGRKSALIFSGIFLTNCAVGWMLSPDGALRLSAAVALVLGCLGVAVCLRGALLGDRLALTAAVGVTCMLTAMLCLSWIALKPQAVPSAVNLVGAISGVAYLLTLTVVLWSRYSYLLEVKEVLVFGPQYDPVTRMRSHEATADMVGKVFKDFHAHPAPMGIIVLTIANLYALEKLHSLAAVNSALFICAGRLRRTLPTRVEIGRIHEDSFLLVVRNTGSARLMATARLIEKRLGRSVTLKTDSSAELQEEGTAWVAKIGIGVLHISNPDVLPEDAIHMAARLSHTAPSYPSLIAWFDHATGEICEMPGIEV